MTRDCRLARPRRQDSRRQNSLQRPQKECSVLLGEPPQTQFDLNFHVLGFPVRVHLFFWLAALILGGQGFRDDGGMQLLIWIGALFSSILIHELGHSLMMRRFGISSHIVLHMMGGLAIPDSFGFGSRSRDSRSSIPSEYRLVLRLVYQGSIPHSPDTP